MKRSILILGSLLLAIGLVFAAPAMAQDEDRDADTMQVVQPDQEPEEVDNRITLPESASKKGAERSKKGRETAGEAREKGRDLGQERAEKAREFGQERAEEVRERSRERATEAQEQNIGEEMREQARDRDIDD